jgi:phage terminase small subunit
MTANLTPRQRRALHELLTSGSVTQAAIEARVSRESVYRWLDLPNFKQALADGESAALESISRALVLSGDLATQTLQDAMSDEKNPPAVKIRAADIVLERLLQLRSLVQLEKRVEELEAANGTKK